MQVFSFFHPVKDFSKENWKTKNNDIILASLENLQIKGAFLSGRNDIHYKDKKISGSAYKINLGRSDGTGGKVLHHGTMMVNMNLKVMPDYITPDKRKLESKGVNSVGSRVPYYLHLGDEYT
jgi:lipoate---protein ligase